MKRQKNLGLGLIGVVVVAFLAGTFFNPNVNTTTSVQASTEQPKAIAHATPDSESSIAEGDLISQLNGIFVNAARDVEPSVVTIYSEKVIRTRRFKNPFEYFFGQDFGQRQREPSEQEYVQRGMGSGVIIDSNGLIVTNNHVIHEADDIRVETTDGQTYDATVVGTDSKTDIAVVKVEASGLPAARLGDSDALEVGEWVLAIGNPFSEQLQHTVTKGIVSAKGRQDLQLAEYEDFIQTDAPINPGNSGGALVNLRGQVVGINTAIVAPSGTFAGIGFAIPINMASKIVDDLVTKGRVVRGWLGVTIGPVDKDLVKALGLKDSKGAVISDVAPGSPAAKAGLQISDVIIEFDGVRIRDVDHLQFMVADVVPGKRVNAIINRGGTERNVTITIAELGGTSVAATPDLTSGIEDKLGIRVSNVTADATRTYGYSENSGVLITNVDPVSEARRKDLREGDLIKEINRKRVSNVSECYEVLKDIKKGDTVLFLAQRRNNNFFAAIEVK